MKLKLTVVYFLNGPVLECKQSVTQALPADNGTGQQVLAGEGIASRERSWFVTPVGVDKKK